MRIDCYGSMLYNLAISLMRSGLGASAFCPKWHVVGLIESRNQPLQKKKKKIGVLCAEYDLFYGVLIFTSESHKYTQKVSTSLKSHCLKGLKIIFVASPVT